jgi:hypothetical protein
MPLFRRRKQVDEALSIWTCPYCGDMLPYYLRGEHVANGDARHVAPQPTSRTFEAPVDLGPEQ